MIVSGLRSRRGSNFPTATRYGCPKTAHSAGAEASPDRGTKRAETLAAIQASAGCTADCARCTENSAPGGRASRRSSGSNASPPSLSLESCTTPSVRSTVAFTWSVTGAGPRGDRGERDARGQGRGDRVRRRRPHPRFTSPRPRVSTPHGCAPARPPWRRSQVSVSSARTSSGIARAARVRGR